MIQGLRRAFRLRSMGLLIGLSAAWPAAAAAVAPSDLNGVWSNASMTRLTRPRGETRLVLPPAEAKAASVRMTRSFADANAPNDPNAGAPPLGADPGGANSFWADPGVAYARVKGQYRSSWIVDPADGQLPLSDEGRRRVAQARAFADRAGAPADPEALQPWDRCLIGSRGSGGPGMLNNVYNSNYQIVDTPSAVAIVVEMIHEVRTIPVFPTKAQAQAGHGPASITPWLGDSVGWREGDVLVVETTQVNAEQGRAGPIFLTPKGRLTERLRRAAKDRIDYAFEVDDPAYYARPWRAEMTLVANPGRLFEYACHEGNYALPNILRGARAEERRALAAR